MRKIILASKSPRRSQLLKWAEIDFEVIVADTDESFPPHLSVAEAAIHIARNKALAVKGKIYGRGASSDPDTHGVGITGSAPTGSITILAADTIVVLNGRIIGKPLNRADGIEILSALSGKTHEVITGVCMISGEREVVFADHTEVEFHELTLSQIEFYMDKYQPYDKAGAYAIQEWIGVVGIKAIRGDFYNVMGLPVSRVIREEILLETS